MSIAVAGAVAAGQDELNAGDLLSTIGGAAAAVAIVAMVLILPLYLTQRREVQRLLRWQELEPERGDEGAPVGPSPTATTATATAETVRPAGTMSPAERITAERPALERITAERAAIQSPSFWRRLLARGPRHPLVLSLLAVVLAVAVVAVVSLTGPSTGEEPQGGGLDRSAVSVVVLNASSRPALADKVADSLSAECFTEIRTGATGSSNQSVVLFAKGERRAAEVVQRELGIRVAQPIDRAVRAAAPDADVVVLAGEDRAKA
jgi:hypothetical protein